MKKLLFFILFSVWITVSSAQEILKMMPAQPTVTDTISFELETILMGEGPACPPLFSYTDSLINQNKHIIDLYFDETRYPSITYCTRIDTVSFTSPLPPLSHTIVFFWSILMDTSANGAGKMDTILHRYATDTINFTVSNATGLKEYSENKIQLYPNPVKEELNVSFNSQAGELEISVLDVNGKEHKIPLQHQDSHKWRLNTTNLPPGVYLLQLSSGEEVYNEKFVKF